jgi:hypothetical protein
MTNVRSHVIIIYDFVGICIFGVLFVLVSLPFALRYEARRRKRPLQYNSEDWGWPGDPQLKQRFPYDDSAPFGPGPIRDDK